MFRSVIALVFVGLLSTAWAQDNDLGVKPNGRTIPSVLPKGVIYKVEKKELDKFRAAIAAASSRTDLVDGEVTLSNINTVTSVLHVDTAVGKKDKKGQAAIAKEGKFKNLRSGRSQTTNREGNLVEVDIALGDLDAYDSSASWYFGYYAYSYGSGYYPSYYYGGYSYAYSYQYSYSYGNYSYLYYSYYRGW